MFIFQTGHASPQFHVVFDDDFETVDVIPHGVEPSHWRWLSDHRCEFYLNDNDDIIDNTKMWTNIELKSRILFEVPQHNKAINNSSVEITLNNNSKASQDTTIVTQNATSATQHALDSVRLIALSARPNPEATNKGSDPPPF